MKAYSGRIIIALLSFFIPLELAVRITDLDMKLIKPLLFYQGADVEVHRVSENTERIYELNPGSSHYYDGRKVAINSFGLRDKERKKEKGKDVFRIVCFGGSNTYGAAVDDSETYPLYLEQLLNARLRGKTRKKYEVWNAGCSAYSHIQDIETAKVILRDYDPDLLIFQRSNDARRAFLLGTDYKHFFRENPSLYWENLRFVPAVNYSAGRWIFTLSYAYRSFVLALNHFKTIPLNNMYFNEASLNGNRLYKSKNNDGRSENEVKFSQFYRKNSARTPIVLWMAANSNEDVRYGSVGFNTINVFDPKYYPAKMGKEYFEIHPPDYVYKWYAESMLKELIRKGYI